MLSGTALSLMFLKYEALKKVCRVYIYPKILAGIIVGVGLIAKGYNKDAMLKSDSKLNEINVLST